MLTPLEPGTGRPCLGAAFAGGVVVARVRSCARPGVAAGGELAPAVVRHRQCWARPSPAASWWRECGVAPGWASPAVASCRLGLAGGGELAVVVGHRWRWARPSPALLWWRGCELAPGGLRQAGPRRRWRAGGGGGASMVLGAAFAGGVVVARVRGCARLGLAGGGELVPAVVRRRWCWARPSPAGWWWRGSARAAPGGALPAWRAGGGGGASMVLGAAFAGVVVVARVLAGCAMLSLAGGGELAVVVGIDGAGRGRRRRDMKAGVRTAFDWIENGVVFHRMGKTRV